MLKLSPLVIAGLFTFNASANSVECSAEITKKLKQVNQSTFQLARQTPSTPLAEHSREFEITCPWAIQFDFDGDRRTDWAALTIKDGVYYLVGHFSNFGKSQFLEIKRYNNFPEMMYLSFMTVTEFKLKAEHQRNLKDTPKFLLIENKIDGISQAYQWNGQMMFEVGSFGSEQEENPKYRR
ncbi:hypothetical protein ACUR5C_10375 [Aliikangiella sp. IMCC44653]